MKHDVFISYSSIDSEVAIRLLSVLERYGLNCWIAPRNIPKGATWAEEIDRAIQQARVFVVIVSTNSVASRQVPKEIALAVSACDGIYPFRIDDIGLEGSFRYYLSDYQFTDGTLQADQKMEELAQVICAHLGKEVQTASHVSQEDASQVAGEAQVKAAQKETAGQQMPTEKRPPETVVRAKEKSALPRLLPMAFIAAIAAFAVIWLVCARTGKHSEDEQETGSGQTMLTQLTETEGETQRQSGTQMGKRNEEVCQLFGDWEMIAYEDHGEETLITKTSLHVTAAGGVFFGPSLAYAYAQKGDAFPQLTVSGDTVSFTQVLSVKNSDFDDDTLTTVWSVDDTYDTSLKMKSSDSISDAVQLSHVNMNYSLPDLLKSEKADTNPTDYTFEDCYPPRYLTLHITGEGHPTPLSTVELDTWLVYEKQYPLLNDVNLPQLLGDWEDSLGNTWHFGAAAGELVFSMETSDGSIYKGIGVNDSGPDEEKNDFFERVSFAFEDFDTDQYAVVSFDGMTLELLDESWNSYQLRRI